MSEMPLFKNVENDGLDCRLFGYICDLEERGGFYDASEVYLAKLGQGFAQTELPVAQMHLNWQGKVQEGVYMAASAAAVNYAFHTLDKIRLCLCTLGIISIQPRLCRDLKACLL